MANKFYLTTAIAYVHAKPHIGNCYDPVLADCVARFHRKRGEDVYFLTGTDEHGQKLEQSAKELGISPQEHVDRNARVVRDQWDILGVDYDQFIRTTDPEHKRRVAEIFDRFLKQGDIYKGAYNGLYCLPCETFYTETQGASGVCPECGAKLQEASEEAYFFKLSKYADRLMEYYAQNPNFFAPESRKNEMIENFLKPGLQDLCVTRTSFTWGVPVDADPKHVVYVWIDALSNYITALGYEPTLDWDSQPEKVRRYWPCDLHIIGKDIVRFHTIYWPIMLMALNVPLPKAVLGHPWMLFGADKMSKSKGNVIYADDYARRFGRDAVRYYMLREMPFAQDSSITLEKFVARYNSDLANDLGNLLSRSVSMVSQYFGGAVDADVSELTEFAEKVAEKAEKSYENYHISDALSEIWSLIARANKYIDETLPWTLKKPEQRARLQTVLYTLCNTLSKISDLIYPAMPESSEEIKRQLGLRGDGGYSVCKASPLFMRLDIEKVITDEQKKPTIPEKPERPEIPPEIGIDDFMKIDLRVGEILQAERVQKSDKLLKFIVDLGFEKRQIVSGIAAYYKAEDMPGRRVLVVNNLKPVQLRGVESQGMLLCADAESVTLIEPPRGLPLGAKVR